MYQSLSHFNFSRYLKMGRSSPLLTTALQLVALKVCEVPIPVSQVQERYGLAAVSDGRARKPLRRVHASVHNR